MRNRKIKDGDEGGCEGGDEGLMFESERQGGFGDRLMIGWTDIGDCRVTFVTENQSPHLCLWPRITGA